MPVRSLNSAVLKWPDRREVLKQARQWAKKLAAGHPEIRSIHCFGSITDDRWGVGGDLDILIEVSHSEKDFLERGTDYTSESLPVAADILVYTTEELVSMRSKKSRFIEEFDRNQETLFPYFTTT